MTEKRKRGRPRTKPVVETPRPWDLMIATGKAMIVHKNVPGTIDHHEALQRYGVPRHAAAYAVPHTGELILIQHPNLPLFTQGRR